MLLGRVRAAAKPGAASASFLGGAARQSPEGLPKQLNVRVGAADVAFPTISSLVQDMESRRDASESLARERVLEMETKLLKSENAMAKEALHFAVGRVLVSRRLSPASRARSVQPRAPRSQAQYAPLVAKARAG